MSIAQNTQLRIDSLKDLTSAVEIMFVNNPQKITPKARQLFRVENVPQNTGAERIMEEYDTKTFAKIKPEGVNVQKTSAGTGYSKIARLKRIGIEIDITHEMRTTGKHSRVKADLLDLTNFCTHRQELDLTHRLTFAGANNYVNMDGDLVDITTGDGLSLINSAHTLAFSSLTYSNQVAGNPAFSQSALEAAETLGTSDILSNFGEKRVMDFNTIITSDHTPVINEVRRLMQSTAQVSAPNNGVVNVYEAKYKHVILPYLATTQTGARDNNKKNYWYLLADGQWNAYLVEWENERLVTPSLGNNLEDAHADTWTFGTRAGYDVVVVSARGIIGSLNNS